jgi:hypothetical protein
MASTLQRLSAKAVEKLTTPGSYNDGGGLYLQVSKGGTKSWVPDLHGRLDWLAAL